MKDDDRSAFAAAEYAAFDGTDLEESRTFDAIAALIERVVAGAWWPGGPVEVRPARRDAASSSARCDVTIAVEGGSGVVTGGRALIRLASSQLTVATAAHELAHVLAGPDRGHGAVYRRACLDVVAVITNLDTTDRRHDLHVRQLAAAFAGANLAVGERSWPPPPAATGRAIAL